MQTKHRPAPRGAVRYLEEILHDRVTRRRVFAVLACLSFAVAFVVVWSLKLTGISMSDEAFCGQPEHVHTDACITRTLVCDKAEHTHTDACYETREVLVCEQAEHTHSEEAGCYDADGNLICTQAEHTHSEQDGCYEEERVLACEQEEHAHSDECYQDEYTCNLEEHIHTSACYSNPQADLEQSSDWEATLPELTGRSADDLVAVAVSQLGVTESVKNYQLDEDGVTKRGYSRYGAWYGNAYGTWSAMFADFCLSYAGNASYDALANSGANAMLYAAQDNDMFHDATEAVQGLADETAAPAQDAQATDASEPQATVPVSAKPTRPTTYVPRSGDLLFLDLDADGQADYVDIVESVDADAYELTVIQGDSNSEGVEGQGDAVERVTYSLYDGRILGFAKLPRTVDGQPDPADAAQDEDADDPVVTPDASDDETPADAPDSADATQDQAAANSDSANSDTANADDASAIDALSLDDEASALSLSLSDNGTITVECYAIVNGSATVVGTITGVHQYQDSGVRLVKASELEPALAALGFSASDVTSHLQDGGSSLMPFSGKGGASFWSDHSARVVDGEAYFVSVDNDTALFYLPSVVANASAYGLSGGTSAAGIAQNKTSASDRFYTVSVKASASDSNPTVNYVRGDASKTISLTTASARNGWRLLDGTGHIVKPDEDENISLTVSAPDASGVVTYSYTFSNISQAYTLEPMPDSTETTITFDLNLSGTYDKTTAPAVYGVVDYSETVPSTTYTLPAPTPASYSYTTSSDKFTHVASFASWTVSVDGTVFGTYAAGDTIDLAGCEGKTARVTANWDETTQGTVYAYAFIDDQKVLVGSSRVAWRWVGEAGRYYLAVDDIARLYTAYGISLPEGMTTSSRYLVAASHGTNPTLWVSDSWAPLKSIDGKLYIPALDSSDASNNNVVCDVCYLPVAGASESSFTSTYGGSVTNPNTILSKKTDMLYTVTVRDDVGDVYPRAEVAYVPNGTENYVRVVRNQPEGGTLETPATWECPSLDTSAGDTVVQADDTTTFTFAKVSSPHYIVRSVDATQCSVIYDLNLQQVSQNYTNGTAVYNDLEVPQGVINANKELVTSGEVVSVTNAYQVLWPDRTTYYFQWRDTSGNLAKYLHVGTFKGWKVQLADGTYVSDPADSSQDWVITPAADGEEALTLDLTAAEYAGKAVRLVAQWEYTKTGSDNADSSHVNFFVDLVAVSEGTTGWSPSTSVSNFTDSLYTADSDVSASVVRNGSEQYDATTGKGLYLFEQDSEYIVLGSMSSMSFGDGDASSQLKAQLQAGVTRTSKSNGIAYTFQVDFPSDEEILSKIRSLVETRTKIITMNGHELKADDLTTDNFTLKWYVFKSSNGDGWHIDGKLVAKSSTIKVTKTFAGDTTAISQVLSGSFAINVVANSGQSGEVNSSWKLLAKEAGDTSLDAGELGYTSCTTSASDEGDSGSITYTWEVPADQYYTYTLTEAGYALDADETPFSVHTRYNVKNSGTASENTRGWADYLSSDGSMVTPPAITGFGGSSAEGLEVDFLNVYAIPGTIAIDKHDMATNTDMAGVSFKISKVGSSDFKVFEQGGIYYVKGATVDGDVLEPDSEADYTDIVTTNEAGRIFLYAGPGTYTLTESPLVEGYENPGTIVVTLTADEDNNWATTKVASVSASGGSKYVGISTGGAGDTSVVDVRNYPYSVDVTLTKKWTDGSKTPVTVQLYRKDTAADGTVTETPVTGCSATLNGAEDTPWSVTWADVPLYAEGQLATYFVRETSIGDSSYTADYDDGYKYYKVSYGAATYYKDGTVITNPAYADTIAFTVENARDEAGFAFTKVNDAGVALEGATFELYGATELAAARGSDASAFDDSKLSLAQAEDGSYSLCYDGAAVSGVDHLQATSAADGNVLFGRQVTRGTYYLFESAAPTNYTADGYVYRITYYDPGYVSERLEGGTWVTYDLNNRFVNAWTRANLTLQKTGKGNVAITGATFELRELDDKGVYATVGTFEVDAGGRATIPGLTAGHYCLVETVTPTAYYKLPAPVYFCVEDGAVTFESSAYIAANKLDDSARAQCGIRSTDATNYILTVNNQTGDLLPATGGAGTHVITAVGAALALCAACLLYGIRQRRRGEANM